MDSTDIIRLELPANYTYLNVVDACIIEVLGKVQALADPGMTINDIRVAVQEACATIVDHAYVHQPNGRIAITFALDEQSHLLAVEIYDTGESFKVDVNCMKNPDPETSEDNVYRLFLLKALMDEVTYIPRPGNNCWRLVKNLS